MENQITEIGTALANRITDNGNQITEMPVKSRRRGGRFLGRP